MKIIKLYINKFRILDNFLIEFPDDTITDISVLIGENGAGKTTVFEAIVEIFSCLILNNNAKFNFTLEYLIPRSEIHLDTTTWGESSTVYFKVNIIGNIDNPLVIKVTQPNGKELISLSEINSDKALSRLQSHLPSNLYKLIPDNIVVYYSGTSEILKNAINPHIEQFKNNSKKGISNIPQVLFYYDPQLFKIILLTLLSFEYGDIPAFLKEKANIDRLLQIKLFFKRPSGSSAKMIDQWNTKGQAKLLFDFLEEKREEWKIDKSGQLDTNFNVSLNDQEFLFQLKDLFREEKELFNVFYALYLDDYLESIEFVFENDGVIFNNLSEGEQQAITIRGLMELLSEENSLFLFDEPDTYLHPKWQQDFLADIYKFVEGNTNLNSSFLISTHSPNLISYIRKQQLIGIKNGKIVDFAFNPYGKPAEDIMIDFFHVESTRNKDIAKKINILRNLVVHNSFNTDEYKSILKELVSEIGCDDRDILSLILETEKRKIAKK